MAECQLKDRDLKILDLMHNKLKSTICLSVVARAESTLKGHCSECNSVISSSIIPHV